MQQFIRSIFAIIVLSLVGCGGGGSSASSSNPTSVTPSPTITGVVLAASATTVSINSTLQLTVSVTGTGNYTNTVTYTTTGGQVSSTGLYTAPSIAGTYTITATSTQDSSKSSKITITVNAVSASTTPFDGNTVLASPTDSSIKFNVFTPDQNGFISVAYGTTKGLYDSQTAPIPITAGSSTEITVTNLKANSYYFYRVYYQADLNSAAQAQPESQFHTARAVGSSFVFTIQGDSHPERVNTMFNAQLYQTTLSAVASENADFDILMGDDFSVDTLDPATINQAAVVNRYTLQRPYLSIVGKISPIFLVNGNHEQAALYLYDNTANNIPVWAGNAKNSLYSQPLPTGFYTGNTNQLNYIGYLRDYYAWTWGDALFVVIDPYWTSPVCVDAPFGGGTKRSNIWDVTHGDAQYAWLKSTLENSAAKYKFVFAHHVMGTQRGGIEVAPLYEWGGLDPNGSNSFSTYRPNWVLPIHQLFVKNNVTIFFQGHDHIWVHQQLDGVTYQTLPNPADPNYSLFNADAYLTGDKVNNSGYARVTVSSSYTKVEYIREFLPGDINASQQNGMVAYSYIVLPSH